MTGHARYRRVETAVWRRTGDALLVLPRRGAECVSLSPSARALWEALDRPLTADEVSAVVSASYGLAPSDIADDVRAALETMAQDRVVDRDGVAS